MEAKLESILQKVKSLCEQNPEFKERLIAVLDVSTNQNHGMPNNMSQQLDKIEEYLGLDFRLDKVCPENTVYSEIDYSFIRISSVRDKLNSDFREMMRYRFGTRSHKADFYEYCKFAHYQLEAIANEFLISYSLSDDEDDDNVDIEIAKDFIRHYWPENLDQPRFKDKVSDVKDIDYFQKITAIIKFLKIDTEPISHPPHIIHSLSDVIGYIRRIRNDISHRSIQYEKDIDNAINKFEKERTHAKISETELYEFNNNKQVKDYLWRRQTPWDDVVNVIIILCNNIKKQIE